MFDLADRYARVRSNDDHARLHEVAITAIYEAVLHNGDSAIDGGAHSGKHTLPMAQAVGGQGHVLAFEPSPEPFGRLQAGISNAGFEHVRPIPKALSDVEAATVSFLVFPQRPGVSGFHRRTDAAGELDAQEITVETTTLDTHAVDLDRVGFIKLDVEGAELLALRGGSGVVKANLPVIHLEASYVSWDPFGYGPTDLVDFASPHGYRIVDSVGTPLDDLEAIDVSFRTAGVWDYFLIPPGTRGVTAMEALAAHAATHFQL